jgi:lysophospholipase L1-like esterase
MRICIFGDSIVWGAFDSSGLGWVGHLREAGFQQRDLHAGDYLAVYNCGVGGDKVSDVLARFDGEVDARQPDAIALAIGINDVSHDDYPGTSESDFTKRYTSLLDKACDRAATVVAITPTNVDEDRPEHDYRNEHIAILAGLVKDCAARRNVPVIDVFGAMTPGDLSPDGLHPGYAGHEKLFNLIKPRVFSLRLLKM